MCRLACLALVFASAVPLGAQGILNPVVSGNQVSATIALPGGLGADLTIRFEQVVGLNLANLGLSAEVVNPLNLALLSRLSGASLPTGFPVLLRIEPPASGGLSFSGIVTLDIHTHNLNLGVQSPLRLLAASNGGPFTDITVTMGMGSYRACGNKGGFSEFLIGIDLRPVDRVINAKLNRLQGILTDNAGQIEPAVHAELAATLDAVRTSYINGATQTAIQQVEAFTATVKEHSGADIPDVWRSAGDLVNVAGLLREAAGTLRFSLNLKSSQGGLL